MDQILGQTKGDKNWEFKAMSLYHVFINAYEDKEHTSEEVEEKWKEVEQKAKDAWTILAVVTEQAMVATIQEIQKGNNGSRVKKDPRGFYL